MQSRFTDSYYIYNSLLVLLYLPLRLYFRLATPDGSDYGRLHSLHEFSTWEKQVLSFFVVMLVWQGIRRRSWDHYAQTVFLYGKITTALTAYQVDVRLLVWYAVLCWVAIAVCPQPLFQLFTPESKEVIALDPIRMRELVLQGPDMTWLVFLYSEQHKESIAMAPGFHELATKYGGPKFRFGCLDATLWPAYCKDALKVTASVWTAALPAVVLYVKGKEVARLPRPEDIDDIGLKRNHFTKADIIRKLRLDNYR